MFSSSPDMLKDKNFQLNDRFRLVGTGSMTARAYIGSIYNEEHLGGSPQGFLNWIEAVKLPSVIK